jgi:hypothetical protein
VRYWFLIKNVFSSFIRIVGKKVARKGKKVEKVEELKSGKVEELKSGRVGYRSDLDQGCA